MQNLPYEQHIIDAIEIEVDRIIEEHFSENEEQRSCPFIASGWSDIEIDAPIEYQAYFDLPYDISWKAGSWKADDFIVFITASSQGDRKCPSLSINMNGKSRADVIYLWEEWVKEIRNKVEGEWLFEHKSMKQIMFDEFKRIHETFFTSSISTSASIEPGMYLDEYMSIVDDLNYEESNWEKEDFYFDTHTIRSDDGRKEYFCVLQINMYNKTKADLVQLWLMWEDAIQLTADTDTASLQNRRH